MRFKFGSSLDLTELTKNINAGDNDSIKEIEESIRAKAKQEKQTAEATQQTAIIISQFKDSVDRFIKVSEEQTRSTDRLNKILFWFAAISLGATLISTAAAVISTILTIKGN